MTNSLSPTNASKELPAASRSLCSRLPSPRQIAHAFSKKRVAFAAATLVPPALATSLVFSLPLSLDAASYKLILAGCLSGLTHLCGDFYVDSLKHRLPNSPRTACASAFTASSAGWSGALLCSGTMIMGADIFSSLPWLGGFALTSGALCVAYNAGTAVKSWTDAAKSLPVGPLYPKGQRLNYMPKKQLPPTPYI